MAHGGAVAPWGRKCERKELLASKERLHEVSSTRTKYFNELKMTSFRYRGQMDGKLLVCSLVMTLPATVNTVIQGRYSSVFLMTSV